MGQRLTVLLAVTLLSCATPGGHGSNGAPDGPPLTQDVFEGQVKAAKTLYEAGMADNARLLEDGSLDDFVEALVDLVPSSRQSAGSAWVLGEALYRLDPAASRDAHGRAATLAPHLSEVAFAWALQELRSGNHREACDTFRALASPAAENDKTGLYLEGRSLLYQSICLMGQGHRQMAAEAYAGARERLGQAALNFALAGVQTVDNPHERRQELRAALEQRTLAHPGELLLLDLMWPSNPWNPVVNAPALERDLAAIEEALHPDDPRLVEYGALVTTRTGSPSNEEVADVLQQAGLLVKGGTLPRDVFVTSALLLDALQRGLLSPASASERFADDLKRRALKKDGHVEDIRSATLCVGQTDPTQLAELDALGWERFKDLRSVLNALAARSPLKVDDPLLKRARRDFPDEPLLDYLSLDATLGAASGSGGIDLSMVANLILAELSTRTISRHLEEHPHRILDGLFKLLETAEASGAQP
ncbi:MAG: hypothetical protein VYE15_03480 [Myxococcota bacterium]|nr:hypothetical protein [Myxococcota bacterium]